MVDPTSDLGEDVDDEDVPSCRRCGDPVDGPTRRVVSRIEEGRVHHRHFCSDDCVDAWRDDER
ncbi:hypothetical protein ACFO0N_00875 [Halobium salinum]|uniref:TRASH domain-containing protein n=1 Tax=Halobium salinum TaxID=1364940 RepID=A0ABD5P6H8_9EURY|nr:hypothetical protein [Halobium salinum]